jgi:hypothetical protein
MRPSVQQPISKDTNVMARARKYYLKTQLFDLEVKGQGPTKVIMVCDTPQYGHAPTYQISLRQCIANRNGLRGTLTFDLKLK